VAATTDEAVCVERDLGLGCGRCSGGPGLGLKKYEWILPGQARPEQISMLYRGVVLFSQKKMLTTVKHWFYYKLHSLLFKFFSPFLHENQEDNPTDIGRAVVVHMLIPPTVGWMKINSSK
jgi:hypothetical protein